MIQNGVFRLKQDATVKDDIKFSAGQEFELIAGVVYMGGHILMPSLQTIIKNWIDSNPTLFKNDTRDW